MKRGEIWTVSGGGGFLGKPRPVVIVQDDRFSQTLSIVVCPFTSDDVEAGIFRLPIEPSRRNGLRELSRVMTDKIAAVRRSKLGSRLGELDIADMVRLEQALRVFLRIGDPPGPRSPP